MPQELHVVRCFACKTFQVQIVKKVPKWQCKICNEKQSVLKVFAQGSGKDCRQYVQDLNMQQGLLSQETSIDSSVSTADVQHFLPEEDAAAVHHTRSKWGQYLENEESQTELRQEPGAWEEDQCVEHPMRQPLRGTKRKLNHQDRANEDEFNYERKTQQRRHTVPNSSIDPWATDILQSVDVNQRSKEYQTSPHTTASSSSNCSKWSQFVSHSEEGDIALYQNNPDSLAEASENHKFEDNPYVSDILKSAEVKQKSIEHQTSSHTSAASNCSRSKWSQFVSQRKEVQPESVCERTLDSSEEATKNYDLEDSASYPANSPLASTSQVTPILMNTSSEKASVLYKFDLKGKVTPGNSAAVRNPFCTTSDDNLDSLLDF